jgi:hypothetical protein
MTPEGPGCREFAQFVANHLIADQDWYVLAPVVNRYRQANHLRKDHGTA